MTGLTLDEEGFIIQKETIPDRCPRCGKRFKDYWDWFLHERRDWDNKRK